MYCRQCGKEVAAGTQFCAGCGAPIAKVTPTRALPSGIGRKIWLTLGSLAGIGLLAAVGTLALDKWREMKAERLLAESHQLVQQGQEAEKKNCVPATIALGGSAFKPYRAVHDKRTYVEVLKYYETALQNMLRIAQDYPSTATAAKLAQTDERLGAYTISELDKTVAPKMREKALILAVEQGNVEAVRNLLGKEVDPNVKSDWSCDNDVSSDETALHIAAARGNAEIVNQLINAGANVNTVRQFEADSGGEYTPLTEAAAAGHAEVVKLLLDGGAHANSKAANYYCLTALGHALARGHKDIVEMLLAAGADLNYQLSDYGKSGFVPDYCIPSATFVAAATGGFAEIVQRMLDRGAPINDAHGGGYGSPNNALLAAAESGHVETVALLVKAGADMDVYSTSEGSTALLTPLGIALKNGHAEVVDVLRKAGAKKAKLEDYGTTKWIMIDETKAVSALIQALRHRAEIT